MQRAGAREQARADQDVVAARRRARRATASGRSSVDAALRWRAGGRRWRSQRARARARTVVSGGPSRAVDRDVGLGIDRIALRRSARPASARGSPCLQQRPVVAPARRAAAAGRDRRAARPRRRARVISARVSRVHEGAAAGRQHVRRVVEQARDHPALAVAERRLAVAREDLGDGAAGRRLDLVVGVDEGQAEPLAPGGGRSQLLPAPIRPTSTMVRSRGDARGRRSCLAHRSRGGSPLEIAEPPRHGRPMRANCHSRNLA